jgi:hypothetical protein
MFIALSFSRITLAPAERIQSRAGKHPLRWSAIRLMAGLVYKHSVPLEQLYPFVGGGHITHPSADPI